MQIKSQNLILIVCLLAVSLLPRLTTAAAQQENLGKTISYLMNYVENSNLIFIRNSKEHSPAEAAAHMQRKYDYFRDKIKTPEDFIRLCASKSLRTGRPYMLRLTDGSEVRCDQWMLSVLNQYRREKGQLE
jgi:hypothetical protein